MKTHLQKHRIKAFNDTLNQIELVLNRKILFIQHYADVYKFPASVARNNVRQYTRQLKAVQQLKNFKQ